tara:strand:+ start:425 stop:628 length:204 start_codon:yes stop_codon:yes gene_type:complete
MKVIIWIKEEDILVNKISNWYTTKPKLSGKWIRVIISQYEFVTLLDTPKLNDVEDMLSTNPDEIDIL